MKLGVLLNISKTHLLSRIKQSSIAALGVTFGIGTFVTMMSFMTGLNKMLDNLVLDRTPHIRLYNEIQPSEKQPIDLYTASNNALKVVHSIKPYQSKAEIKNALPILENLKNHPEVLGATPQVKAQAFYVSGAIELNGIINGIDPLEEDRLFNLSNYIIEGSLKDLANNSNSIILGAGAAKKMSLKTGDRIQLATPRGDFFSLKIVGLYQSGLAEIDNAQSYTNLNIAQRLQEKSSNFITDISIKLHNLERAVPLTEVFAKQYKVSSVDIKTANAQFEVGTTIRNMITYAVSITLLIVAGFGIYNILNMLIYEKMNDIAILKATGFTGRDVRWIFISQAMLIGLIGGGLGLLIGLGLSTLISTLPFETEALPTIKTFPVNFNPAFYIIGITFALIATFFAGYLPARKAQRIDPVEIIRGQ
ncbi:MAG: FtsX-like permease family protein [Bacteroidota bacterium]